MLLSTLASLPALCGAWSHLYQLKLATGAKPKNITRTYLRVREIMDLYVDNHVLADYEFPARAIKDAKLNGSMYPTIVPYQVGPLPKLRQDVICNPEIFAGGCTTFGEVGRRIGGWMVDRYDRSAAGKTQERVSNLTDNLNERLVKGLVTNVKADKLELDPGMEMLMEIATNLFSPLVYVEQDSLWLQLMTNVSTSVFDALMRIDRPTEEKNEQKLYQWKVYAALLCRLSNGRLPNCGALANVTMPELPIYLDSPINELGFFEFVFVWGFNFECMFRAGCIAGTANIQPENFDGAYSFDHVDSNGLPVYRQDVTFRDFGNVHSLWLWHQVVSLHPREPQLIAYYSITPNAPDYYVATTGAKAPFASFMNEDTPDACVSPQAHPMCTSGSDRWALGRNKFGGCGGTPYRQFCMHEAMSIIIGPTNSSDAALVW